MSTRAFQPMQTIEVQLWGRRVGAATLDDRDVVTFEYSPDFLGSGMELAPLTLPLRKGPHRFPGLPRETFHGLPGLLADSLPDRFGNALIDAWLARQGRTSASMNVLERLCYVGTRAMGALEYHPPTEMTAADGPLEVARLVRLAAEVLADREAFRAQLGDDPDEEAMTQLLHIGTSAGGARAKALIALHPETQEVRAGHIDAPAGFQHWLLKFDGVDNNRDRELNDPQGFGALEYAYHRMAIEAGIEMAECRLLEEGPRRHFMTRRFDRDERGRRLHMLTLGAVAHLDFNAPGAHSWEEAFQTARRLHLGQPALDQLYLRMLFNVMARNQDDHVKNIAFLMDRRGRWFLAPAYDLTFSYNPQGAWTRHHQMSIAGKVTDFDRADLIAAGKAAGLPRHRADQALRRVREVVAAFPALAKDLDVEHGLAAFAARHHRLSW